MKNDVNTSKGRGCALICVVIRGQFGTDNVKRENLAQGQHKNVTVPNCLHTCVISFDCLFVCAIDLCSAIVAVQLLQC